MADLVTIEQAWRHLRLTFEIGESPISDEEADLQLKLDAAEGIVLDYLGNTSPPLWEDENDVPPLVAAAILLQLGELWEFRGDQRDGQGPAQTPGDLSPVVTNLLRRYRDPALA
jgi:hypothetical protein